MKKQVLTFGLFFAVSAHAMETGEQLVFAERGACPTIDLVLQNPAKILDALLADEFGHRDLIRKFAREMNPNVAEKLGIQQIPLVKKMGILLGENISIEYGMAATIDMKRKRALIRNRGDASMTLYDMESGEKIREFCHERRYQSAVFDAKGERILVVSFDGTVQLCDVQSGNEIREFKIDYPTGLSSARFDRNEEKIVSASADNTVRLWDVQSGRELRILRGHTDNVGCAAFDPEGKRVVSGSDDKTVRLWDVESGNQLYVLNGHDGSINSVEFDPEGKKIVSGSDDGTVRVWDAQNGAIIHVLKGSSGYAGTNSVVFCAKGNKILAIFEDRMACLWDVHTGSMIYRSNGEDVYPAHFGVQGANILLSSKNPKMALISNILRWSKLVSYMDTNNPKGLEARQVLMIAIAQSIETGEKIESDAIYKFSKGLPKVLRDYVEPAPVELP